MDVPLRGRVVGVTCTRLDRGGNVPGRCLVRDRGVPEVMEWANSARDVGPIQRLSQRRRVPLVVEHGAFMRMAEDQLVVTPRTRCRSDGRTAHPRSSGRLPASARRRRSWGVLTAAHDGLDNPQPRPCRISQEDVPPAQPKYLATAWTEGGHRQEHRSSLLDPGDEDNIWFAAVRMTQPQAGRRAQRVKSWVGTDSEPTGHNPAGAAGLEPATPGFGDRCSAN